MQLDSTRMVLVGVNAGNTLYLKPNGILPGYGGWLKFPSVQTMWLFSVAIFDNAYAHNKTGIGSGIVSTRC